jgi:hypothetical protein
MLVLFLLKLELEPFSLNGRFIPSLIDVHLTTVFYVVLVFFFQVLGMFVRMGAYGCR